MARKQVPIDWNDLEIAVERNAPTTESFLELTTGQVVTVVHGDPETPEVKRKIAANIKDYLRVEPASSREQYRWMERFVTSVEDEPLRERLTIAIDGKGAFRRFKDVLLAYPAERERWFTYRSELLHWHIHNWLDEHGIEATTESPWGAAQPPAELPAVVDKVISHSSEAPGEALRRRARELIDTITAIELPSAIAFLEFLRARGLEGLAPETTASGDGSDAGSGASGSESDEGPDPDAESESGENPHRVAG